MGIGRGVSLGLPWISKILAKKIVFLVSRWKKQILLFLATRRKILEKSRPP